MGYWGWRPLLCGVFISTWVVGCNVVNNDTSPSDYPDVTLTVGRLPTAHISGAPPRAAPTRVLTPEPTPSPVSYLIQPGDTYALLAERFQVSAAALRAANPGMMTLVPGESLMIASVNPLLLDAPPPTCYETRPDTLLCLGRVDNPFDFPVENVRVEVSLFSPEGAAALIEQAVIEQRVIPSGGFAPYQTTFETDVDGYYEVVSQVSSAQRGEGDPAAVLLISEVEGVLLEGRVVVSAVIFNAGGGNTELLRVFVTLLDGDGRVLGYRVLGFDGEVILGVGENLPLNVEITPQVTDVTPEYSIYVEARNVP